MKIWIVAAIFAANSVYAAEHSQPPLVKSANDGAPLCDPGEAAPAQEIDKPPPLGMTICEALRLAEKQNPDLQALGHLVEARLRRSDQAKVFPNPTLGADHDQWAKQTTLQLSEQIETGGKRQSRIEAASADRRAAAVERGAKRLEIFAEVKKAFIEVLFLQEQLTLNEQRQALARQILATARTRAEAGRGMKIEVIRAELALADAHISQDRIRDQLNTAQRTFFTTIGTPDAPIVSLRGNLFALPADAARQHPASFEKSPDSTRASAEMGRREAAIKVEEAKAAVDVTVSGGIRYFGTEKKAGIVVGLTVPIPVFNRNSGSIREAYEELEAAKLIYLSNTSKAAALFSTAAQEAATAYREAKSVRETLLPGAKAALAAANEAFQRGKLDYLNVLDAQRAYFESEERQLRALTTYHKAVADLERYAGQNQLSGTVEENANEKK